MCIRDRGALEIVDSEISGRGTGGAGYGITTQSTAITVRGSVVDGDTSSIDADFGATINVLSSRLLAPIANSASTFHCVGVAGSTFLELDASCV